MHRKFIPLAALAALALPARAQSLDLSNGHVRFTLSPGRGMQVWVRGVPFIRESHLYIVKPGWTGMLLNQDNEKAVTTSDTNGDVKTGAAAFETADASARYDVTLEPNDTLTVRMTYNSKGRPADIEYDAGYLNANILRGEPFTAQTLEGERSGTVPLYATSEDQTASKLTPDLRSIAFATKVGRISINVTGTDATTSALTLFDARGQKSEWALKNPVFWLGIGVPPKAVSPGDQTVSIVYRFGEPIPNTTVPTTAAAPEAVPVKAARVPYTPDLPVIPHPKKADFSASSAYRITPKTRILIPTAAAPEEIAAARDLQADLKQFWGVSAPIARFTPAQFMKQQGAGGIYLFRSSVLRKLLNDAPPDVKQALTHPEGYALSTDRDGMGVIGADARGVYNGAQTLKQLIRVDGKGVYVRGAEIKDWPSLPFRGVHWFGGPKSWPFHQRMIDRIAAPLKMNAMVYQVDFSQWATQPKIWRKDFSTPLADVKKTVDYARAHFMEPIPLVNSLGHSDWMFANGQNLDLATDPVKRYQYDPTKPRVYTDIVFPVMQEAIDLFHPKTFHIGHDEITTGGKFPPDGATKSVSDLIVEDTVKIHDWLKAKGIRTMMWGDELLHYPEEASDAGNAPLAEAAKRRAALPKDIVIADWHYQGESPDYPSVSLLQKDGFTVVGTPWFKPTNIQNFARVLTKEKSLGLLQSTWAGFLMSPEVVRGPDFQQFVAYLLGAEYAWNGGEPGLDKLGYDPDTAFLHFWDRKPVDMHTYPGFTVDLSPAANAEVEAIPGFEPGPGKATPLPAGKISIAGVTFEAGKPVWLAGSLNPAGEWPKAVTVSLGGKPVKELQFLWASAYAAERDTPIARLSVTYADGTSAETPVRYGRDIAAFTDTRSIGGADVAWRGTNALGQPLSLRRWTWTNPNPKKPVASLTLTSETSEAAPVLLGVTAVEGR